VHYGITGTESPLSKRYPTIEPRLRSVARPRGNNDAWQCRIVSAGELSENANSLLSTAQLGSLGLQQ